MPSELRDLLTRAADVGAARVDADAIIGRAERARNRRVVATVAAVLGLVGAGIVTASAVGDRDVRVATPPEESDGQTVVQCAFTFLPEGQAPEVRYVSLHADGSAASSRVDFGAYAVEMRVGPDVVSPDVVLDDGSRPLRIDVFGPLPPNSRPSEDLPAGVILSSQGGLPPRPRIGQSVHSGGAGGGLGEGLEGLQWECRVPGEPTGAGVVVPDVVGLPLGAAIAAVREGGLDVVGRGAYAEDPQGLHSIVFAQEPPAGARVPGGAYVGFRTRLDAFSAPDPSVLCPLVERIGAQREDDITDPDAISDLVSALPSTFLEDAALFYYPYGGDVPPDASGAKAQAAGERLYQLYDEVCAYAGP